APDAGYPAAPELSSGALPAFPAGQVRELFVLPAAESAGGPPCRAAGNDNAGRAASAAAPPDGDTCLPNTAAGRQGAGRVPARSRDSTCPTLSDAAPSHGPSALPSGAAHPAATRESTREDSGSSARGYAGRTAAQSPAPQATRGRCISNSRTSNRPGKPSTCRRKRNSWQPPAAHSRPGSPAPVRAPGTTAG